MECFKMGRTEKEGGLEYVYSAVGQMVEVIWVGDLKGGG